MKMEPVARFDLDAIGQAIEERDQAIRDTELLAQQMVFHGNSVSWWYSKAIAYRDAIDEAWKALKAKGVFADGNTTVAQAIAGLAPPNAEQIRAEERERCAAYLRDNMRDDATVWQCCNAIWSLK
jgi:hypothetical protein